MKKKICDLKPGTPFKYKGRIYFSVKSDEFVCLTDGIYFDLYWKANILFENGIDTLVTVCKRIRKSDIKERK